MGYSRRRDARVDDNQKEIVRLLRCIPGVTVQPGHDDILVGNNGKTYWFEIKHPSALKKDGTLRKRSLKDSQRDLKRDWTGHYAIVSTLEEILAALGMSF